jgi:protein O-GlcNAc transferase
MASADTLLKDARRALLAGRASAAVAFVDQALAKNLDARHGAALFELGNRLAEAGQPAAAVAIFERMLQLFPGHPQLMVNLGAQLDRMGDASRAERYYREALARGPGEIAVLANLAHLLFMQERYADALEFYDRLVAMAPDAPADVWNNRGVCQKHNRDRGAETSFRRALALAPDSPQVLANLGFLLTEQRRYDDARPLLEKAHALDPSRLQVAAQCVELELQFADWGNFERDRADLIAAVARPGGPGQAVPPFAFLSICDDPALQLAAAKSFAWPSLAACGPENATPNATGARDTERLRLGFAASAFHEHPVPRLIVELLERLDRSRFEIFAYELDSSTHDAMRARITGAVDTLVALGHMRTVDAVARIRTDRMAILFDLTGHTEYARPDIFAARPAPVQVNYLGHAGTLGAPYYDYLIGDATATPPAERPHFMEKVVALPHCYFPSDSQRQIAASTPTRAAYGLPPEEIVFISQAAAYKILPDMFGLWMQLLGQVDGSVLWLRPLRQGAEANLRKEAARRNIDPQRLVFAPQEPAPQYLARYRLADLYIDTYPFGSHTTVNDALFAGLPVVTLAGRSMASRGSASQLRAVGLPELIAGSHEAYLAIALGLVRDRNRLAALAVSLRGSGRASPLFDMQAYARQFEAAITRMWRDSLGPAAKGTNGAQAAD